MNSKPAPSSGILPVYDEDTETRYSIEVIAQLAGVAPQTVLHYREQGFIRLAARAAPDDPAAPETADEALFDVECLRQLRRIEHLRATCEVNDTGLKLILNLLHETECLREERRQTHR